MVVQFTTSNRPSDADVKIALIRSAPMSPESSVEIVDYSTEIPENKEGRRKTLKYPIRLTGATYYVSQAKRADESAGEYLPITHGYREDRVVVTNKALYNTNTNQEPLPLYYQYQSKFDHYDNGTDPSGHIRITNEAGDTIQGTEYAIEYSNDTLHPSGTARYTDSFFWGDTASGTLNRFRLLLPESLVDKEGATFYVQYNKAYSPNATIDPNTDTERIEEIINPTPLYQEEERVISLDHDYTVTDTITTDSDKQLQINSGTWLEAWAASQYDTTFADSGILYVKKADTKRIRIVIQPGESDESWYVGATKGEFVKKNVLMPTQTSYDIFYYVPEEKTGAGGAVNWAQGKRTILPHCAIRTQERVKIVNPYTLKTAKRPIFFWEGAADAETDPCKYNYPDYTPPNILDVGIEDDPMGRTWWLAQGDANERYSHGITIYRNNTTMSNTNIRDWDFYNGIIKLKNPVEMGDIIYVTYLFRQDVVMCTGLDLNPTIGHTAPGLTERYGTNSTVLNKTIRFVIRPYWKEYGDWNWGMTMPGIGDPDTDRRVAWHYLSDNPSGVYSDTYATVSGWYGYPAVGDAYGENIMLPSGTLPLADVTVKRGNPNDIDYVDARQRGGGIKEDDYFMKTYTPKGAAPDPGQRKKIEPESEYYWDIGFCLPTGTKVTTETGQIPIENIRRGDKVYTHSGKAQTVTRTTKRECKENELMSFRLSGSYKPLVCTKGHPILVLRERHPIRKRKRNDQKYSTTKRSVKYKNQLPQWIKAHEVEEKGDMLLLPKRKGLPPASFSPEMLYVMGWWLAEGHLGGEKTCSKNDVGFSIGDNEAALTNCIPIIKETLEKEYPAKERVIYSKGRGSAPYTITISLKGLRQYKYAGKNMTTLVFNSPDLVTKMRKLFGTGATHKKISQELFNCDGLLPLVCGWIDGDGHQRQKHGRAGKGASVTTASEQLAWQMRQVLIDNGIYSCVMKQHTTLRGNQYLYYTLYIAQKYISKLKWSRRVKTISGNHSRALERPEGFYVPITQKSNVKGKTTVFNLETTQDHSYIAEGVVVHNCDGKAYQGDGALVIQIPQSVREDIKTNIQTEEPDTTDESAYAQANLEIRQAIEKYVAYGEHYVVIDENHKLYPFGARASRED